MEIISEVVDNPVIPSYSTKALKLALNKQIEPYQSSIKLIAKNIEL